MSSQSGANTVLLSKRETVCRPDPERDRRVGQEDRRATCTTEHVIVGCRDRENAGTSLAILGPMLPGRIDDAENPVEMMLVVMGEIALAWGADEALVPVHGMMIPA